MNRTQIFSLNTKQLYDAVLKYFDIRELVSPGAYNKYKHYGDYFFLSRFDKRLLEVLLWVRTNVGQSIIANNWLWNGRFDERGLRDTSTPMVQSRANNDDAWLSGHVLAMAIDYHLKHQKPEEHREWLQDHEVQLPHKIRLEHHMDGKPINWVHLDVCDDPKNPKVYLFNI